MIYDKTICVTLHYVICSSACYFPSLGSNDFLRIFLSHACAVLVLVIARHPMIKKRVHSTNQHVQPHKIIHLHIMLLKQRNLYIISWDKDWFWGKGEIISQRERQRIHLCNAGSKYTVAPILEVRAAPCLYYWSYSTVLESSTVFHCYVHGMHYDSRSPSQNIFQSRQTNKQTHTYNHGP
jgi:hypothetical protein